MAKRLGMSPKSLMKNQPGPSQRWKKPVKIWIRDLHEHRFGPQAPPKPGGQKTPDPARRPAKARGRPADFEDEIDPWDADFEHFQDFASAMLPHVEFDVPLQNDVDDPDWERFRRARRQQNLCWLACTLTAHFRGLPAVDTITVFGSVATSLRRPFGQPWDGPEAATMCHTLNLAVWVTAAEPATLCSLDMIIRQTLTTLADIECITLHRDRLEVLLVEASSDRFLGLLRPGATPDVAPSLEMPSGYVFRLEPLREPQAIVTFRRHPPPPVEDDDVPF